MKYYVLAICKLENILTVKKWGNMSNNAKQITVAYGDGIGPEIMDATLRILKEAGANISVKRYNFFP